jgi:spermidine synthase
MEGFHLTADCYGCQCNPELLLDAELLQRLASLGTVAAGLTIVGEKFHPFRMPDGSAAGVTCALLLAESHVAIHTWPERQAVTLDVYVCNYSEDNTAKAKCLFDSLITAFCPTRVQTHQIRRGESAHSSDEREHPLMLEPLTPHTSYGTRLKTPSVQLTTAYQHIEIADSAEFGTVMRVDGAYMTSERDEFFYHECLVHPAAVTHPAPRRALIVGGGDGGATEELLKHPSIEHVTLCEIDPAVVELARRHLRSVHHGALDDPRVEHIAQDGFAFVRSTYNRYDLILLDLTDPSTLDCATPALDCYTTEFFAACRQIMTEQSALVMHLGSPFYHPERFSRLHRQLSTVFSQVRPYTVFVPLYGALWGMAVAGNGLDPKMLHCSEAALRLTQRKLGDLQYYNAEIHAALFALPNFVQNLIRYKTNKLREGNVSNRTLSEPAAPATQSSNTIRKSATVPLMLAAGAILTSCSKYKQDEYANLAACTTDWSRAELCQPKQSGSGWLYFGPRYEKDQRETLQNDARVHANSQAAAAAAAAAVTSKPSRSSVTALSSNHADGRSVSRGGFGDSAHVDSAHVDSTHGNSTHNGSTHGGSVHVSSGG